MTRKRPFPLRHPAMFLEVTLGCMLAIGAQGGLPAAKVDALFAEWSRSSSPGASVVIVKDGAVVYQRGYGCADLERGVPISEKTVFDVASVAKQFTGLAVAMLVKQGQLSMQDDLRKYLPEVPDFGRTVTIGHLVHHTSGVRDWCEVFQLSGKDAGDLLTLDMILDMVRRQQELDFPPGEEYQYSNTGYNLLAAVIQKVTAQPFRAWMETNLFRPLGMSQTFAGDNPDEVIVNRALSYARNGRDGWRQSASRLSAPGSSSLFASAEDMGKWLANFDTGKVAGKETLETMAERGVLNNGRPVHYGCGVGLGKYRGLGVIEHSGSWAGYRSKVLIVPGQRFAVAILANASNLNGNELACKIADLCLDCLSDPVPAQPKKMRENNPDAALWDSYVGTYRLGPAWLLTISREGDQLIAQATREAKFPMTPISEREFFVKAYDSAVRFVRKGTGPATHLDYRGIHAPRLELPESTPAYLGAFAGDYWSAELRANFPVRVRGDQLQAWHPLTGWVALLPTGQDQFDASYGFAIRFTRDSESKPNGMLVSGNRPRNLRFTRTNLPGTRVRD